MNVGRKVRVGVAVGLTTSATTLLASQASSAKATNNSPSSPIERLFFKSLFLQRDHRHYTLVSTNRQKLWRRYNSAGIDLSFNLC